MTDYMDFVLGINQPKGEPKPKISKKDKKADAFNRDQLRKMENKVKAAEKAVAELQAQCSDVDRAMFDPSSAKPELAKLAMSDLVRRARRG